MPEPQTIITRLGRRAATRKLLAVAGILVGLPLCLVAAFTLGPIFWIAFGRAFGLGYPWYYWVSGTALLTIPLLFRTELRTGGDYLGNVARSGETINAKPGLTTLVSSASPVGGLGLVAYYAATNPRAATAGFVELFLAGPRMVINGARHIRIAGKVPNIDIQIAAQVLRRLMAHDTGLTSKELAGNCESRDQLQETLIWLAFYGWIGVSTKQDRVYIYSESRRFLSD